MPFLNMAVRVGLVRSAVFALTGTRPPRLGINSSVGVPDYDDRHLWSSSHGPAAQVSGWLTARRRRLLGVKDAAVGAVVVTGLALSRGSTVIAGWLSHGHVRITIASSRRG